MAKILQRKLLLFFIALLMFSTFAYLTSNVEASDATVQQKGAAVTSNIIGLDLTKYSVVSEYDQGLFFDVLPQENLR